MIHERLRPKPEDLVGKIALKALDTANSAQTHKSGSVTIHNADGTKTIVGSVLGTDSTMTSVTTATHVGDTTPPGIPTGVTAWSGDGAVHVAWDGTLTGGIPADFCQVNLLVDGVAFASLNSAGSATYNGASAGTTVQVTATSEDDACAIDGTAAHNVSSACSAISVTVTDTSAATAQHFWADTDGAHISSTGDHDTSGFHQLMTSVKNAFMHGSTELMTISENLIELGKNSTSAIIRMCGGKVAVSAVPHGRGTYKGVLSGEYGAMMRSTNGTASVAVDGFQDLISMVSGYLQVDDGTDAITQVSMRRFLTAIQPVMLYNGGAALRYDVAPGDGTTGTVTLSETAANFKEMTIFYRLSGGICQSVVVPFPDGKTPCLQVMMHYTGNPVIAIFTKTLLISGTSVTVTVQGMDQLWTNPAISHYDDADMLIYRITGRR